MLRRAPDPTHARQERDLHKRLGVFLERGLIERVPTRWQLLQGQLEMAPYVIVPDPTDGPRYQGTLFGHPLLRTPLVFSQVGWEHVRIGHGLDNRPHALYMHLNFVFHEGMPTYDLQLVHTVPDGLATLRRITQEIEDGASAQRRVQRTIASLIIPDASSYRRRLLQPGGWIERAERFEYPTDGELEAYQRPEFTSVVGFMNYCASAYPASPTDAPLHTWPARLIALARRRFADRGSSMMGGKPEA